MIVIDASAMLELLLGTPAGQDVQDRLFQEAETLHAPHLLDLEVVQVLRKYCALGDLDPGRGSEALADLSDLPIQRYPHQFFLPRVWELRHNLTAYDAVYVALAEALGATFLTSDSRLASAPGLTVEVDLI